MDTVRRVQRILELVVTRVKCGMDSLVGVSRENILQARLRRGEGFRILWA